jgi:hypothetical protein
VDAEQSIIAKVSGAVLLAFGVGLGVLAISIVERQLSLRGAIRGDAAAFVVVAGVLGLFCSTIGYRLTFNRPNRYNSILSPTSWLLLTVCFGAIGIAVAAFHLYSGAYIEAVGSFAFASALVYGCVQARRGAISNKSVHGAP